MSVQVRTTSREFHIAHPCVVGPMHDARDGDTADLQVDDEQDVAPDKPTEGERIFMNVATGGLGTGITVATDPKLKKHLGGAAYLLTGLSKFTSVKAVPCRVAGPDVTWQGDVLVLAVGNGRQAGGGNVLCPDALIDDGLLDVAILPDIGQAPAGEAVQALMARGVRAVDDAVVRFRVPWIEIYADSGLYINLDGEPTHATHHRFDIAPGAVQLILPGASPLLAS